MTMKKNKQEFQVGDLVSYRGYDSLGVIVKPDNAAEMYSITDYPLYGNKFIKATVFWYKFLKHPRAPQPGAWLEFQGHLDRWADVEDLVLIQSVDGKALRSDD